MSARVLLAALVLLGLAAPQSASAEPQRGLLVVEGRGGTVSELVLERTVQLSRPLPELTGGREFAAVLLEPLEPGPGRARAVGAVRVPAFRDATSQSIAVLGFDGELQAGRYRVTLLGDAPVRAAFSLSSPDAPGIVLRPRSRLPQQFFGRSEVLPFGYGEARVDLPAALPAGRRVIQVGLFDGVAAQDTRMCATTGEQCTTRLLPQCPQSLPCPSSEVGLARPRVTSGPMAEAQLLPAQPVVRALRWSTQGYRDAPGRLRAAAIVF